MIIHPLQDADTTGQDTPYDTVWSGEEVPVQESTDLERVMLAQDKIYVVLAVVLIIWIGLALLVVRTDRKLALLERKLDEGISETDSAH